MPINRTHLSLATRQGDENATTLRPALNYSMHIWCVGDKIPRRSIVNHILITLWILLKPSRVIFPRTFSMKSILAAVQKTAIFQA